MTRTAWIVTIRREGTLAVRQHIIRAATSEEACALGLRLTPDGVFASAFSADRQVMGIVTADAGDQHPEWDKTGEGALPRGVAFGCGIMLGALMWAGLIAWSGRVMGWW